MKDYNFELGGWSELTKDFTQMVWASTTTVGFGVKGKFAVARYCPGQDLTTTLLEANEEYTTNVHTVKPESPM